MFKKLPLECSSAVSAVSVLSVVSLVLAKSEVPQVIKPNPKTLKPRSNA
jgi:hypothetical protein